jgi:hypothetical protein
LQIPGTALLAGAKGTRVAVIDENGTLHYRSIEVGRDYGDHIEVLSGLAPSDLIATVLPAGIADGAPVKAQEPPAPGPAAGEKK